MSQISVSKSDRENGAELLPRFDAVGLVTAVVCDVETGLPLMVAHMNEEALRLTVTSREAHFFSRSRNELWHKGATSGNVLEVVDVRIDCDQDAVWLSVNAKGHGAACHTGQKSCFYRRVVVENGALKLQSTGDEPLFDPTKVYSD